MRHCKLLLRPQRTHLVAPGAPLRAVTGRLDMHELERWLKPYAQP